MLSAHLLTTLKPLVTALTPAQRLELIRWIATESARLEPGTSADDAWTTRISAEAAAWYAKSEAERAPYTGQYVAVLHGQVVDHDPDRRTLAIRVRRQYPTTPVLITEAEAHAPREYRILSPRRAEPEVAYG